MSRKENFIQIVKFTLLSASAGIIQVLVDILCNEVIFASMAAETAVPISYAVALTASVLYNFTLNRKFTFKSANNVPVAMLKVAGYYAVFGPLSYWITEILANRHPEWKYWLLAGCMLVNFVTEFLFDKFVVFRGSENTDRSAKKKPSDAPEEQPTSDENG